MNLKKHKAKMIIGLVIIIVITTLIASFFVVNNNPLTITETSTIEVKDGDTFYNVLDKLNDEGKLKGLPFVKIYSKLSREKINIMKGKFTLEPEMSTKDLINVLKSTPLVDANVITIPEGYNVEKIAKELDENQICKYDDFINAVKNYNLPEYIKIDANKRYNLEGFLYPDTYHFAKNTNPDEIIKTMLNNFENVISKVEKELNIKIKKEDYEKIVTIASLIQNECRVPSEAEKISSVIYNRINKDMKLQIDATVIYALGYHVDLVLNSHLAIDSPYNTYKYSGLPLGAISNPGKASIIAALNPADTDYLFYLVEDPEVGSHFFTGSDNEFMKKREELGYNDI